MTFPAIPLGNQFSHPHLEADADLHAAVDTQLNALRTASKAFGTGLAQMRVARRAAGGLLTGVAIVYDTIVADTASGYNASTGLYTIPGPGLYLVEFQTKQSTAVSFTAQLSGLPAGLFNGGIRSSACAASAGSGPTIPLVPVHFLGGELVGVVPSFGGSVSLAAAATVEANFFSIHQVA